MWIAFHIHASLGNKIEHKHIPASSAGTSFPLLDVREQITSMTKVTMMITLIHIPIIIKILKCFWPPES